MKRFIILISVFLLFFICVVLLLGYQSLLKHAFSRDSDFHWVHDNLNSFIIKKGRFPKNWEEMHEFAAADGLYPSIQGIEERVVMNFPVFLLLNGNLWQIESIDEKDQWVFYFQNQKSPTTKQDTLKKYCETLVRSTHKTSNELKE